MTPTLTSSAAPLREAFYALSLARRVPDAELLDDVVRRFPQYGDELTNFAVELAIDALRSDFAVDAAEAAIDPDHVSPAVSRAMSRFHNRLHAAGQTVAPSAKIDRSPESAAAQNPFASLSRSEFRAFVGRIDASTVFVAKLRDRQIEPETMSDGFRRLVADELRAPVEVVVAHFAASHAAASLGRQFYKADEKPNGDRKQTFAEAVRNSGLTEAQQQRLLGL